MSLENTFVKTKILNDLADAIGVYGENSGVKNLLEQMDLNCGAIPEGPFEKVCDTSSPQEFVTLYAHIAEKRFAFAVTVLLKINPDFLEPVKTFLYNAGSNYAPENIPTKHHCFSVIDAFVLDGIENENQKILVTDSESQLIWKNSADTHKIFWEKVNGSLENYYILQSEFINGLLSKSKFKFSKSDELFKIEFK